MGRVLTWEESLIGMKEMGTRGGESGEEVVGSTGKRERGCEERESSGIYCLFLFSYRSGVTVTAQIAGTSKLSVFMALYQPMYYGQVYFNAIIDGQVHYKFCILPASYYFFIFILFISLYLCLMFYVL